MNREELSHVLRAAAEVTGEREFVIVGSQAALAQLRRLPGSMASSLEIDIYPRQHPEKWELIDGALGRDSDFDATFKYHADGIGPETAKLPADWEARSIRFQAGDVTAIAPEINDLAVSKLVAGRHKDLAWIETGLRSGLINPDRVAAQIRNVSGLAEEQYVTAERRIADRRDLLPDPEKDALRLDPATTKADRSRLMAGLDDEQLLRRMSATGLARQAATAPSETMELIEGFKALRAEAGRRQLLFPEQTPVPAPRQTRDAGRDGPSL